MNEYLEIKIDFINFLKKHKKLALNNICLYEDIDSLLLLLEKEEIHLTLPSRVILYLEILSKYCDEKELINKYSEIFKKLREYQITNCKEEDKWYFKNLGLL